MNEIDQFETPPMELAPKARKALIGRPPVLTVESVKRICDAFGRGLPIKMAAAAEGVTMATFCEAARENSSYHYLYLAARERFLAEAMERLAKGDSNDLKWLLERRYPQLFKRPPEVEVNSTTNVTINNIPADLLKRAQAAAKKFNYRRENTSSNPRPGRSGQTTEVGARARAGDAG